MFVACENRAGGGNSSDAKIPPTDVPHLTQFRMLFCSHRHPTASREWRHKWRGSGSWFWKLSLKEMVKKKTKKKTITETIVYLLKGSLFMERSNNQAKLRGLLYSNSEASWLPASGSEGGRVIWSSSWQWQASLTVISKTPSGCQSA